MSGKYPQSARKKLRCLENVEEVLRRLGDVFGSRVGGIGKVWGRFGGEFERCVGGGYAEDSSGNKFYKGKEVDSSSISHFNKKEFKHIGRLSMTISK